MIRFTGCGLLKGYHTNCVLCTLVYKALHDMDQSYLWSADKKELKVPRHKVSTYGLSVVSASQGPQLGIHSQYIHGTTCHGRFQAYLKHTCSAYPLDCKYFGADEIHFVNTLAYINMIVTYLLTYIIFTFDLGSFEMLIKVKVIHVSTTNVINGDR